MNSQIQTVREKISSIDEALYILKNHPDKQKGKILSEDLRKIKELLMLELFEETIKYVKG